MQVGGELLDDVFDNIGADGADDIVRDGAEVRWSGDDGLRMAVGWGDDDGGGTING